MTGGGLGGGVIFVVAALLWAAVLVPAWVRRREFRAAERNAARLQRTLRVLAETSEVPEEVRIEATAREALAQEKLLRTAQKRQDAEREARLADARAAQVRAEIRAQQMRRKQIAAQRAARLRRPVVRRVRALSALGALVGLVGALVGAGLAVAGSGIAMLAWSGLVFATSLGALVLLAPGRARVRTIADELVENGAAPAPAHEIVEPEVQVGADELDSGRIAHAAAQRAAAERMERARALARARAERPAARENQTDSILLRDLREQVGRVATGGPAAAGERAASTASSAGGGSRPEASAAAPIAPRPAAPQNAREAGEARRAARRTPSARDAQQAAARERLSRMGVVGDTSQGMPDLDAALRRRRTVG